ncbi:MAG: hypothetical protein P1V35_15845 [Planctomycetota bacterium]|nr:hypothetical protein [Planctomycetota bacterium]
MSERRSKNEDRVNPPFQSALLWGQPWEGGQGCVPPSMRRGDPARQARDRLPVRRLGDLSNPWPTGNPELLSQEAWCRVRACLEDPGRVAQQDLKRLLGLDRGQALPKLQAWIDTVESRWFGAHGQPLPASWARLVVPDWRGWLEAAWTPILRALVLGERLVLLADEHLPELLDPLLGALDHAGVDLSGIGLLWDQRNETVSTLLEFGVFPGVSVVGPEADRGRWDSLISNGANLHGAPPAVDLAFGFGVQPDSGKPHLEWQALTSSCRNLEKPMLQAGENWQGVLEQALFDSLGTQGALGGYLNGAVGQWILPASHFSVATEWLLNAIESRGVLDPPMPSLNRASKAELEGIRARALGEGATLIHESLGSTGKGQNGTLTRQIFTNVRPGSGLSMAPGNTPTLLLSRGDLGPYEAPYKGGIR